MRTHDHEPIITTRRGQPARYAALALALSWLVWIPGLLVMPGSVPIVLAGAFGPAVAGAIMVRADGGRVRDWLRGMAILRVAPRWYAAALIIPLLQAVVVNGVAVAHGVPLDVSRLGAIIPMFIGALVFALFLGGGQEELGWRGYLLAALQERTSPVAASVAIGGLWGVWHLPLFFLPVDGAPGPSAVLYLPLAVAMAVMLTWLFNHTRGSVVLAMLMHASFNASSALVPVAEGVDPAQLEAAIGSDVALVMPIVFGLVAVALVGATRGRLGPHAPATGKAGSSGAAEGARPTTASGPSTSDRGAERHAPAEDAAQRA